jgi:hypothetical protein
MTAGLHAAEIRKPHRAGVAKAEIARRLRPFPILLRMSQAGFGPSRSHQPHSLPEITQSARRRLTM